MITRTHKIFGAAGVLAIGAFTLVLVRSRSSAEGAVTGGTTIVQPHPESELALAAASSAQNPVSLAKVARVKLSADLQLVGSVTADQDQFAVVGPLISGRVSRLRAGLGDRVRAGQVLAEIESNEVGQAQATFLASAAKAAAAQANLRRERDLAAQKISSERDHELAEALAVSEDAEARAAVERLRAFGLADSDLAVLRAGGATGGRVPLRSPIAGTVVKRTITLGQAVERATDAFKIINLSKLWVMLDVYEKDLTQVHVGQKVRLRTESRPGEVFDARVSYVNPVIDEKTRTAAVRISFDNPELKLRPGQFVTARLLGDPSYAIGEVIAAPRRAVTAVEGRNMVFRKTRSGFAKQHVELGVSAGDLVEIKNGLAVGDEVASDGAFLLKSELLR